jgi:S-adenosyl-L-methionine hydrolase (adenosine-forming)
MGTIVFASDYGRQDPFVGVCHAVIARIAPDVRVVDLSHDIAPHDVRHGAVVLADAAPYLPPGVVLAVVDPGVGTARRAVVAAAGELLLVGPDNGLLWPLAERVGDVRGAWEITEARYRLTPPSRTFHGRDIFAPAAAHLANGVPLEDLGPAIEPATLVQLDIPEPRASDGRLETHVLYVDTFGNAKLTALADHLRDLEPGAGLRVRLGDRDALTLRWRTTFGDARIGEPLLYEDSYGRLCLAVNQGDAATNLGLEEDMPVVIEAI